MKRALRIPLANRASRKRKRLATSIARWKPIALTWRKTSRATQPHFASVGGAAARSIWSPRFNLHVQLAITTDAVPSRNALRSATASPIQWRLPNAHFTSFHLHARSFRTTATRHVVNHRSRDVVTRDRANCAAVHGEISMLFRPYTLSTPARSIRSTNISSVGLGRIHASAAIETTTLTRLLRTTWWSHHRTMRLAWRTRMGLASGPSVPSTAATALRVTDLVWRIESQAKMLDVIERSISAATSAVSPSGAVRAPQFEQSPAPFGFSPARTLDPALIDRVADDVIGRVERRIRIERERRGV